MVITYIYINFTHPKSLKVIHMKVYISIPISGYDVGKVQEHIDIVKAHLSRKGYTAISPLEIYAGKNPTYKERILADLEKMLECDAVYFCNGWCESSGCRIEHKVAEELGMLFMYETRNNQESNYYLDR